MPPRRDEGARPAPASLVALATCAELPAGDPDDHGLPGALAAHGVRARWQVWDDPAIDWSRFDAVVVRSTWDYQLRRDAFLAWAAGLPRVLNPLDVLAWSTDKSYLADLAGAGLPVVPSAFAPPGATPDLPAAGELVVKPSVSAGSKDTARFCATDRAAALALVGAIHASGRTAMVQPYLASVDARGETALVYLDGAFSHAVRKGPLLAAGVQPTDALFAAEDITPRRATGQERAVADEVIGVVAQRFGALAYARVDLVAGAGDRPVVLELELAEPSLFLAHDPRATERLAAAIARRAGAARPTRPAAARAPRARPR